MENIRYLKAALDDMPNKLYPIGAIYHSALSTNPNSLFGVGTWSLHGVGKATVCVDVSDTKFDTAGKTYGEQTHLLTGAESGEKGHNHLQDPHAHEIESNDNSGATITRRGESGSTAIIWTKPQTATNRAVAPSSAAEAHNNIQPSIAIYRFVRTA